LAWFAVASYYKLFQKAMPLQVVEWFAAELIAPKIPTGKSRITHCGSPLILNYDLL
jgi:hypothetical protein